jgi:hypothetical protein
MTAAVSSPGMNLVRAVSMTGAAQFAVLHACNTFTQQHARVMAERDAVACVVLNLNATVRRRFDDVVDAEALARIGLIQNGLMNRCGMRVGLHECPARVRMRGEDHQSEWQEPWRRFEDQSEKCLDNCHCLLAMDSLSRIARRFDTTATLAYLFRVWHSLTHFHLAQRCAHHICRARCAASRIPQVVRTDLS